MACSDGAGLLDVDPTLRETGEIKLDLETMMFLQRRLDLGAMGVLSMQIARAAAAKRPSELQRLLLAIVRHRDAAEAVPEFVADISQAIESIEDTSDDGDTSATKEGANA